MGTRPTAVVIAHARSAAWVLPARRKAPPVAIPTTETARKTVAEENFTRRATTGHPTGGAVPEPPALEPFWEADIAEALRAYEGCGTTLADELGTGPSVETESVYLKILRSD
jgi:hypothetical protein